MKVEECRVGMKVIISQEADGFYTKKYHGKLATIENIYPGGVSVDIYCEDKRIDGIDDGLIKGVHPSNIDMVVSYDSIECDVDVILI